MTYTTEFPDFPAADMPRVPAYWRDTSWHNDTCPSFEFGRFRIFIDYADPAMREFPGDADRFSVHDNDPVSGLGEDRNAVSYSDWADVLKHVGAPDFAALANEALNAAVRHIQDALNITDGLAASLYFSGDLEAAITSALADYAKHEVEGMEAFGQ